MSYEGTEVANLDLFRILVEDPSAEHKKLAAFGIDEDVVLGVLADEVKHVTTVCHNSLLSAVPLRTSELRRNILISVIPRTARKFSGELGRRIYISGSQHVSSVTPAKISNSMLAEILDEGEQRLSPPERNDTITRTRKRRTRRQRAFRRSRSSQAVGGFSIYQRGTRTQGWIEQAQSQALRKLGI